MISENLRRADLTQLQRKEQIAEWIKLTDENKPAGVRQVYGGRGNEGGLAAAAREIGVKRTSAQEAIKVASLSDEAHCVRRQRCLQLRGSVDSGVPAGRGGGESQSQQISQIDRQGNRGLLPQWMRHERRLVPDIRHLIPMNTPPSPSRRRATFGMTRMIETPKTARSKNG